MSESLAIVGGLLTGLGVGFVAHELAHYVVAAVAGRRPALSLWPPRVGLDIHGRTWDVRLAAVAPALLGVVVVAVVVSLEAWSEPLLWSFAVGMCVRLFALSPEDRDIALGETSPR